ncbi:hypothetical protein TIFTF001_026759 [Ficus carica]|uniref:Uncharacterized protein n=1 Tax=Ficus carica TaxID=3494 RepID=A0AA88DMR5_FICCA|nr:hypothetical protein TIFTF001_026759 [Ficus carica]
MASSMRRDFELARSELPFLCQRHPQPIAHIESSPTSQVTQGLASRSHPPQPQARSRARNHRSSEALGRTLMALGVEGGGLNGSPV